MKKEEFLNKLESKIKVLDDSTRKKVLKEYEKKINKRTKDKEKEEEVIKSFGDINNLAKEILKKHNINPDYKEEVDIVSSFNNFVSTLVTGLRDFFKSVFNGNSEELLNFVLKLIILFIIVCVLKIPFLVLEMMGKYTLGYLPTVMNNICYVLWKLFIDLSYIVTIILILFSSLKKDMIYFSKNKEQASRATQALDDTFKKIIIVVSNALMVLVSVPLLLLFIVCLTVVGILIAVMTSGVYAIGMIIFVFGLAMLLLILLTMLFSNMKVGDNK